ncbi:MAG: chloride channel protein [Lachnospiraceae bacterium]|nr:chloride channel protein [Lachnospiraceae bacterium]
MKTKPIVHSIRYLFKWTLFSLAAGAAGGLTGALFAKAIRAVTGLRTDHPWIIYLLPVIGAAIALLYKLTHEEKNRGTNMVLTAISEGNDVTVPTGPLIFVSTILSHLGGASVGREGAALQLGGWMGRRFGELLHFSDDDRRIAVMSGMSAVFAALFGTPVAAAIFCIEVVRIGVFHYVALIPCVFSAFIGSEIAKRLGVQPELWPIGTVPWTGAVNLLKAAGLGLCCALLSILLVISFHRAAELARKLIPNAVLRAAACGALIAGLTLLLGTTVYSGAGTELISLAMAGNTNIFAFLLKLLFTALAIAGGFKGGEIVPTLSIGACFGALFGTVVGLPVPFAAALGMIAVFAGATNCPIASLMIAMEMFQGAALPFFAITVTLSFVLSGYYSLYGSQRFAFSKTGIKVEEMKKEEADPVSGKTSSE